LKKGANPPGPRRAHSPAALFLGSSKGNRAAQAVSENRNKEKVEKMLAVF